MRAVDLRHGEVDPSLQIAIHRICEARDRDVLGSADLGLDPVALAAGYQTGRTQQVAPRERYPVLLAGCRAVIHDGAGLHEGIAGQHGHAIHLLFLADELAEMIHDHDWRIG
ncbi:hypothetical protein BK022_06945 [Methylorubrum extorquens]|uniref:Uncharacterized protein n=1 Tax=Methylorubrum extorquens TaxID=408 RepID=A0A1S1PB99_METEX|nr:hypothetical protein BK022_06945 [Methylorubrum extorquens]